MDYADWECAEDSGHGRADVIIMDKSKLARPSHKWWWHVFDLVGLVHGSSMSPRNDVGSVSISIVANSPVKLVGCYEAGQGIDDRD
jgi:hypothetical protein